MKRSDLSAQLARWKRDRMAFRGEAILLEDGRPFGEVMESWQRDDFLGVDTHRNSYRERPRGTSKTGDTGTDALTDLVTGPPHQRNIAYAVDKEQAGLLHEDVAQKFARNPLLRSIVKVTRDEIIVKATDSRLRVLASDAPSAYGLRFRRAYIDELAEQDNRAMWDAIWTATGKRPDCGVHVISTAGWDRSSIAWEVREIARTETNWYFSTRGQCASWIRSEWLEQQRRTLPAHVFARLHEARWVDGVGAFLTSAEVDNIFGELPAGEGPACIGLDLGVSKDRSTAAVVQRVGDVLIVRNIATWDPKSYGGRVPLQQVEEEVAALAKQRNLPVHVDFWQAALMKERLEARGVQVREVKFTGDQRRLLFSVLLDLVRTGRLKSVPHEELKRELLGLEVQQQPSGAWRVDHRSGKHDDHVVAVALAAQAVVASAEIPAGAWFMAAGSSGQPGFDSQARYDSTKPAGGYSAFDGVEQRAKEIEQRPWMAGLNGAGPIDWDF